MRRGLRALFGDFGGDADRAGRCFADAGCEHVLDWSLPARCFCYAIPRLCPSSCTSSCDRLTSQPRLRPLIRDKKQRGARSGPDNRTADAGVDAAEAAGGCEAGGGLDTGF